MKFSTILVWIGKTQTLKFLRARNYYNAKKNVLITDSLNQETTLSGKSIVKTIQKAKELGYEIHLRYVGVNSPEIAKERVANRIARGGHGVSGNTIERRFETSKDNFLAVVPLCDSVILYDNTDKMTIVAYILNGIIELTPNKADWATELLDLLKNS